MSEYFAAIDSSYKKAVCILFTKEKIIHAQTFAEKHKHGQNLYNFLQNIDCNISTIFTGVGPGSFIGVRIAVATALGFQRGQNLSIIGVKTHKAIFYENKDAVIIMKASFDFYYVSIKSDNDQILTNLLKTEEIVSSFHKKKKIVSDCEEILKLFSANATYIDGPCPNGLFKACLETWPHNDTANTANTIKPYYLKTASIG